METSLETVFAKREDVLLREVAGEHLLVPIRRNVADMNAIFALNGVGRFIWEQLDGERTIAGVLSALVDRFDVSEDEAKADLNAFVERLSGTGMVERRR